MPVLTCEFSNLTQMFVLFMRVLSTTISATAVYLYSTGLPTTQDIQDLTQIIKDSIAVLDSIDPDFELPSEVKKIELFTDQDGSS